MDAHYKMLRELAMRAQVTFPGNEEDLQQWEQGMTHDFFKRLNMVLFPEDKPEIPPPPLPPPSRVIREGSEPPKPPRYP